MKSLLYHRVQPKNVYKVLKSKSIKSHESIIDDQICMTRNVLLMSETRPFVVVFDRDKLRERYKIVPFCFLGWKFVNKTSDFERWRKNYEYGFESEERILSKEIPLDLAEYVGFLECGCYDYKNPKHVHSERLFQRYKENRNERLKNRQKNRRNRVKTKLRNFREELKSD